MKLSRFFLKGLGSVVNLYPKPRIPSEPSFFNKVQSGYYIESLYLSENKIRNQTPTELKEKPSTSKVVLNIVGDTLLIPVAICVLLVCVISLVIKTRGRVSTWSQIITLMNKLT